MKPQTFTGRCETEQAPERVLEIIRTRIGPDEPRSAFILGDRGGRDRFVGRVGKDWFTVRRTRFPASAATPILRASVEPSARGASLHMVLTLHPLTRLGVIAQIVLVIALTAIGVVAGLRNPIFFIGVLFVDAVQLVIALSAHLARRRDWRVLTDFVCGAVGGSR